MYHFKIDMILILSNEIKHAKALSDARIKFDLERTSYLQKIDIQTLIPFNSFLNHSIYQKQKMNETDLLIIAFLNCFCLLLY